MAISIEKQVQVGLIYVDNPPVNAISESVASGIIEAIEGSYGARLFIRDHVKLEEIPRGEEENKLGEEVKKFQDIQKAIVQKMESFQVKQEQKKKDLFAEMEKKLREELDKKS